MDLSNQKRMAASVLKCGVHRVWIDPDRMEDVFDAVTRNDIRILIKSGAIDKAQKVGISKGRARYTKAQKRKSKRRGHGSRKGTKNARDPKKRRWIRAIRPIRRKLRSLRDEGQIDKETYRKFYRQASGGMFKNSSHLMSHLEMSGYIKGGK